VDDSCPLRQGRSDDVLFVWCVRRVVEKYVNKFVTSLAYPVFSLPPVPLRLSRL